MKKRVCIWFVFILLYNFGYAQKATFNTKQYVLWEENINLSWDYFKKKKHTKKRETEAARISARISYSSEINEKEKKIIYYVQTYLDKKASWSFYHNKKTEADSYDSNRLLNHELGHFNIMEIYARENRKLFSEISANSFEEAYRKINKIRNDTYDKMRIEQNKYDKETEYGTNKEKQAEWDKKIAERLKELEQYKDIAVTIRLQSRK